MVVYNFKFLVLLQQQQQSKPVQKVDGASETSYAPVYDDGVIEMSTSALNDVNSLMTRIAGHIRLESISPKRIFNGLGVIAIHCIDLQNDRWVELTT